MTLLHLALAALFPEGFGSFTAGELVRGAIRLPTGIVVAILIFRLVRRVPWPRPFRFRFAVLHAIAAPAAAATWLVTAATIEALVTGTSPSVQISDRGGETMFIGTFLYVVVAGLSYSMDGAARAARAEATATRTQLAALRAQLHPHFLFNSLHAIVQLIPVQPDRAAEAAELVAELLRATLEEQRDEVTLGDEWSFVSRYLAVERIRFGERLVVRADLPEQLLDERVPAFALQTLVENAVHHGAAPRVAPTQIVIGAEIRASDLVLSVRNDCDAGGAQGVVATPGTGLARLRERLAVLYGSAARLSAGRDGDGAFEALLAVPRRAASRARAS